MAEKIIPFEIQVKRIYDAPNPEDGYRILVDRLWPRGIKKADASVDLWLKEIAPTDALRKWFNHDPEKWDEFQGRYFKELDQNQDLVDQLILRLKKHKVTFVFSARDVTHNNAIALKTYLLGFGC